MRFHGINDEADNHDFQSLNIFFFSFFFINEFKDENLKYFMQTKSSCYTEIIQWVLIWIWLFFLFFFFLNDPKLSTVGV